MSNVEEEKEIKRCFVMMPFSQPSGYEEDTDHFIKVYEQIIKPAVEKAGYESVRVDEDKLSTDIVTKIFNYIIDCEMAVCDLSSRNPNVLYELGIRQAYDKPVVLMKDDKTNPIFDVSGITTMSYSSNRLHENVEKAKNDLYEMIMENANNQTSVVKLIKADKASFENVKLSNDEEYSILLRSMRSDINDMRKAISNIKTTNNMPNFRMINNKNERLPLFEVEENSFELLKEMTIEALNDGNMNDLYELDKKINERITTLRRHVAKLSDENSLKGVYAELMTRYMELSRMLRRRIK